MIMIKAAVSDQFREATDVAKRSVYLVLDVEVKPL